jgi:hypothetical protein
MYMDGKRLMGCVERQDVGRHTTDRVTYVLYESTCRMRTQGPNGKSEVICLLACLRPNGQGSHREVFDECCA